MTNPNALNPDSFLPRLTRATTYLTGGLLAIQGAVLADRLPGGETLPEQKFAISIESEPVIAEIIVPPTIPRSTVTPSSTGILPPELTQPECVRSPIAWLPDTVARWHPYVAETAKKFDIPPALLDILMVFETLGDPEVTSYQGAEGLIQILPSTALNLANELGIPTPNLKDPVTNIYLSGKYIRNVLNTGLVDLSQGFNTEAARRVAIAYHGGKGYLDLYNLGGMGALAEMPKTRRYAERIAMAWDEQSLPTSHAYNELMEYQGPRDALAVASQRGTPPC